MRHKLLILLVVLGSIQANAQCSFDPIIEGDILFCPNQTSGELTCNLQSADTYQWLSRPFNGGTATPIAGAIANSLSITNSDILTYFSVEVTISGCTERSPEVLIDQLLFLFPTVETSGDYIFDGSAFLICEGDSMVMTLMPPYDTNIIWYRDGEPIPGENNPTLEVTEPGSYTVSGAPAVCPNYIQFLGIDLEVLYNTDPNVCDILGVNENESITDIVIYPNPVHDKISIVSQEPISSVAVRNILGQLLYNVKVDEMNTTIDISGYSRGTYFVQIKIGSNTFTKKIIKQ